MTSKIQIHPRQKMACVYLRQSTMAQVYHHQESTQRQYALKDRALELGWPPDQIRVLDAGLGHSGAQTNQPEQCVASVSVHDGSPGPALGFAANNCGKDDNKTDSIPLGHRASAPSA